MAPTPEKLSVTQNLQGDAEESNTKQSYAMTRRASRFCSLSRMSQASTSDIQSFYNNQFYVENEQTPALGRRAPYTSSAPLNLMYKYHNHTWQRISEEDVEVLNGVLLNCALVSSTQDNGDVVPSATSNNSLILGLLARFFPHHPLSACAVASVHLNASRGHPVIVDFLTLPNSVDTKDHLDKALKSPPAPQDVCERDLHEEKKKVLPQSNDGACTTQPIDPPMCEASTSLSTISEQKRFLKSNSILTFFKKLSSFSTSLSKRKSTASDANSATSPLDQDVRVKPHRECNVLYATIQVTFHFSAGLCVTRSQRNAAGDVCVEALVIRRKDDIFYGIPKGHLEQGEALQEAAERELREETGLLNPVRVLRPILSEIYTVKTEEKTRLEKTVHYFTASLETYRGEPPPYPSQNTAPSNPEANFYWSTDALAPHRHFRDDSLTSMDQLSSPSPPFSSSFKPDESAWFSSRESETRDIKWVSLKQVNTLHWKSNTIKSVVLYSLM